METLALYALKTGCCLAVFYLFFKLLLSRETLHRFNRLLLLTALLLAFVLPCCVVTITREVVVPPLQPQPEWLPSSAATVPLPAAPAAAPFPWAKLFGTLYVAGAIGMLLLTLFSTLRVMRLIRRGRHERMAGGWTLVRLPEVRAPFSWWRYVVVAEEESADAFDQILIHERAHWQLHHSLDLLLTDLAGCLQWFNPAMWLLRSELRAIHEYEADAAVLDSGADARQYQIMLIKKAAGRRWYSIANSFNHSNLKNRITMMLQKRSSRWAQAKALVAVPLVCVALGAFARTVEVPVADKSTKNSEELALLAENSGHSVTIRVEVVNTAGEPLAGVAMQEVGTARGVVTDAQGMAELSIDDASSVDLILMGYHAVNLSYRNGTTTLRNRGSMNTLRTTDELVEMRVTLLREGETLSSPQQERVVVRSASTTLRADAASQPLYLVDGEPVDDARLGEVVVLSTSTVLRADAASQPLYLVDGKPVDDLQNIDPKTIASIDVLKSGEATQPYVEQYGDKARNGVVLVHLKHDSAIRVESLRTSDVDFRIVGTRTVDRLDAASRPLYLVDGKPVEDLQSIDPKNIDSIDVLKGDELTQPYVEQYGDAARNGVVLVHLKSEAGQELQTSLSDFDSEAWEAARQRFQEQQKQFVEQQEHFNEQQEHFSELQERFRQQQDRFQEQQERFKEQQARYQEQSESYFESDEWRAAQESLQSRLQAQAAYFESDEWRAAQEALRSIGQRK